jgi:hypothetical protein
VCLDQIKCREKPLDVGDLTEKISKVNIVMIDPILELYARLADTNY